ncbi:MAG: CBS domain-containing protein [Alphaproteobacteria bacterium]
MAKSGEKTRAAKARRVPGKGARPTATKNLIARDLMTRVVHAAKPETRVERLAAMMIKYGISAVPVIDKDRRIVGIVSEGDLFRRQELGTGKRRGGWLDILIGADRLARDYIVSCATTAKDVMSKRIVSATEDTPVSTIADMLESYRIKRVPVVRGGKLVGIVSRADLIRMLATQPRKAGGHPDSRKIHTIFLQRLKAQKWASNVSVNVVVRDRVVELWGQAATDEQIRAVGVLAESIPGVRSVRNRIVAPIMPGMLS